MTARLHPAQPTFEHPTERMVCEALCAGLPDGSVVVANQRMSDRKGDLEADLVAVVPGLGIAVLEVKGGRVEYDPDRGWLQTGGGVRGKEIDPVSQARRAMYALRSYLDRQPAWGRRRTRWEDLVVLPASDYAPDWQLPELPRWALVDRAETQQVAAKVLDALTRAESENPVLDEEGVAAFVEVVCGRPGTQREMVAEVAEREAEVELLTGSQAHVLDLIRRMPRVHVVGGAGSGKTWLALEQARRLTKQGQRVALLCYSRGLATFLQRRVAVLPGSERPAYVGLFHDLGVQWGARRGRSDDSEDFETRLPAEMRALAPYLQDSRRFDAVVVDEAQDFATDWWGAVLAGLRDPDEGRLYVFSDEGQRVFSRFGELPVDMPTVTLDENLRNTKQIAQTFGSLTASQMRYRGGDGPPVRVVSCATQDAVEAADDEVLRLLEEGWGHEHVALLTTGHRHPVQVERQLLDPDQRRYWESFWEDDDVFYGHVLGFKGMERPVVVLAVNGFQGEQRAREKLYVGLSRARDLLVVCGDPHLIGATGGEAVMQRLGWSH
ncbi:MAG: NERD domain-containing protein [Actinomycetales bacterium]